MSNQTLWVSITAVEIVMLICFNILFFKIQKIENKIDSLKKGKKDETD